MSQPNDPDCPACVIIIEAQQYLADVNNLSEDAIQLSEDLRGQFAALKSKYGLTGPVCIRHWEHDNSLEVTFTGAHGRCREAAQATGSVLTFEHRATSSHHFKEGRMHVRFAKNLNDVRARESIENKAAAADR